MVIGAGAAGLAAAQHLVKAKCTVTILEARDRLGGRIWSHDPWARDDFIDLGAEFVHDSVLAHRFSESGLIEIDERQRVQWDDWLCRYRFSNQEVRREGASRCVRLVLDEKWYGKLDRSRGSVANAIQRWPSLCRRLATAEAEGLYAADTKDLNAQALYEQWSWWQGDEKQWWPRGGYQCLIDKLRQRLNRLVRRADPVTKIECVVDRSCVRVTTRNKKQFEATRAIVAVPLGILKSRDIAFVPRLSHAKRVAIQRIGMGDVVKIAVRAQPFGRECRFISSDQEIPVWWPLPNRRNKEGVIIGWAGGPAAKRLRRAGSQQIKRLAICSLKALFPGWEGTSTRNVHVVDWTREEFAKGAYSYDRFADGRSLRGQLAEAENNLLFFAGEATEPLYYGTVHGALRSGERAANSVLESLRVCA